MSKRDFAKARRFANMSNRGYEPVAGSDLAPSIPKRAISKVSQSAEAASMVSAGTMITKAITCRCGHKGKVRVPMARINGPFRCVMCNSRIQ